MASAAASRQTKEQKEPSRVVIVVPEQWAFVKVMKSVGDLAVLINTFPSKPVTILDLQSALATVDSLMLQVQAEMQRTLRLKADTGPSTLCQHALTYQKTLLEHQIKIYASLMPIVIK